MAPGLWCTLRRPVGLALVMAIVLSVGGSDARNREGLAQARLRSTPEPTLAAQTLGVAQAANSSQASPGPAATSTPQGGRQQAALPAWRLPGWSARGPEGAPTSLQPSEAAVYLPTEAGLLSPSGRYAPVRAEVRIGFNLAVWNRRALEQAFRVEPAVGGILEWLDNRTLRFRPDPLAYGATYRVRLATGAPQGDGGREWQWTFTTMKKATFTFDDCPTSPAAAQELLAFLRQHQIRAITFPTGACIRQYPWLVPALLADGHQVCNHTYSHADLPKLTDAQMSAEIAGGVHAGCNLLRPPYGDWDGPGGRVERAAGQQGYRLQFWDVDTLDWTGLGAQAIVARIYDGGGGVVLMHFQGRHTLEALKLLDIPSLTGQSDS